MVLWPVVTAAAVGIALVTVCLRVRRYSQSHVVWQLAVGGRGLVTENVLLHGRRAALGTSLGVSAGLSLWTFAAAVGVASLVRPRVKAALDRVTGIVLIAIRLRVATEHR